MALAFRAMCRPRGKKAIILRQLGRLSTREQSQAGPTAWTGSHQPAGSLQGSYFFSSHIFYHIEGPGRKLLILEFRIQPKIKQVTKCELPSLGFLHDSTFSGPRPGVTWMVPHSTDELQCKLRKPDRTVTTSSRLKQGRTTSAAPGTPLSDLTWLTGVYFRASDDTVLQWKRVVVELVRRVTASPPQISKSRARPDAHLSG